MVALARSHFKPSEALSFGWSALLRVARTIASAMVLRSSLRRGIEKRTAPSSGGKSEGKIIFV